MPLINQIKISISYDIKLYFPLPLFEGQKPLMINFIEILRDLIPCNPLFNIIFQNSSQVNF